MVPAVLGKLLDKLRIPGWFLLTLEIPYVMNLRKVILSMEESDEFF